jgi:alpha-1,3-rhamnosyl/mannosyltransferase
LKYLGFVPQCDLPSLYAGARAFVYPSIYEGFGLPVLEAMASGVPVVASPFTSLPEVTQGAALLVDPDDVDALTAAVHRALIDENWRQTFISSGLAVAQTFSWDKCVNRTIEVYQSISD